MPPSLRRRRRRRSVRCRAAPDGRCGTRLRRSSRPRRSPSSSAPFSIAIVLKHRRRRLGIVIRRGAADNRSRTSAASSVSRSSCASSRIGSATWRIVPLGETRLVVVDQRDDVAAGNVAVIDDREAGRVEVEVGCSGSRQRESSNGSCGRGADWETGGRRCIARAPVTLSAPSLRRTLRPTACERAGIAAIIRVRARLTAELAELQSSFRRSFSGVAVRASSTTAASSPFNDGAGRELSTSLIVAPSMYASRIAGWM